MPARVSLFNVVVSEGKYPPSCFGGLLVETAEMRGETDESWTGATTKGGSIVANLFPPHWPVTSMPGGTSTPSSSTWKTAPCAGFRNKRLWDIAIDGCLVIVIVRLLRNVSFLSRYVIGWGIVGHEKLGIQLGKPTPLNVLAPCLASFWYYLELQSKRHVRDQEWRELVCRD